MARARTRGWSLATQTTVLVTVAVAVAVVVVGTISLVGVHNLARDETDARMLVYRQLMLDHLSARLGAVSRLVDVQASRDVIGQGGLARLRAAVATAGVSEAEYLDMVAVADSEGRVLAISSAQGPDRLPEPVASIARSQPAHRSPVFLWVDGPAAGQPGSLWIVHGSALAPGARILVARIRTSFMTHLMDEITRPVPGRVATVISRRGVPVALAATGTPNLAGLAMQPPGPDASSGAAVLRREGDERRGYYADVTNVPGLAWRVLVLDRTEDAMVRARQALLPAALAFLAAACVSILSVFVWSRRLVRPLTTFERRAREVASGGYARPIDVHREDEVGGAVEAFNEMSVRLNSLQDMAQLLAGGSNLSDVLDSVLSATSHILGTGEVAVFLVDEHHTAVDLAAGHGVRRPGTSYRVPLDAPSPIATALADRKMVSFRAPADEWGREVFDLFDADPERQAVAAPLIVGDEMVGVIVVVSEGSHSFSDAKTETLKAFSAHAALAVQNSRLFAQERASRTRAEALREIAEFIAGPIDLEEAFERVGSLAADLLGMSGHALAIADRAGFGLERAEDSERHARLLELWGTSAQRSGEKVARLDPVRVLDGTVDSRVCEFLGAGDRTIVLVPLVREDAVTGVLALTSQSDTAALDAHDIALARTIGGEMSLALENAWLLQQARSRAANLETIFRISQAVSSSLQLSVVLNRVLDVVQKIFSADAVSLMAYDAASRSITTSMARGVSSRDMLYLTVQPGQDLPGVVFAQGSPVSHGDLAEVDTPLARLAAGQGLHSMLAVPLLARGRSIGVLSVFAQEPSAFTGEDMELLLTFAVQAALAIDTAGLYGREHHVATVLQTSILPDRPPTIAGLETHAFYLPVGLDAEIGGDFYDLFQMRDGRTVIAIGDVCGKGVLAATKTSMIKYSLRGMVSAGATPAEALTELNRLVSVSEDPSDIVTAWIGFLDVSAGSLTYADAGHPPALLHHMTDGGIERLGPTGPLLGALATSSYSEVSVVVRPGDLLLTYTDGVTEARRDGEFFGEDRVRGTVGRAATAEQAVSDLLEQLSVFSSGVMRDDAAVLAVRTLTEEEITRGRDQSQSG